MKRKHIYAISILAVILTIILIAISINEPNDVEEAQTVANNNDIELDNDMDHASDSHTLNDSNHDQHASFTFEPITLKAEDAELVDLKLSKGVATGFTNDTGSVHFSFKSPGQALFTLKVGYRTPHGFKATVLLLNGERVGEVELEETDGTGEAFAGNLLLSEGTNVITLEKGWGWYDIEYIHIALAAQRGGHEVRKALVNPNATKEAKALMSYLVDQYGQAIISGQQEYPNSNLIDVNYVIDHTGKTPAILGLDFIDNTPSRVERGTSAKEAELGIDWWHEKGGIVAFTWHWNAPKDLIDKRGKEWYRGFYTEATTFDIKYALDHPDSEDYELLIRDIDAIAVELKKLQDADVPVLWRPLHEAEGGWFWWGAKGPGPVIELWHILYERLTHHHELNNLIWVWNSVAEDWYPGDDVVDIVSYDSYPGEHNYHPISNQFEQLIELGSNKKLIAMAENGPIPDPDLMIEYSAHWSWFSTWNGEILREHNDIEHLNKVYNHPYVITLEDLPDLKNYQ